MKNQVHKVHEEMRQLISRSCAIPPPYHGHGLYNFQKDLLRHFFKTVEVTIDHGAYTITLWNSESPKMPGEDNLYSLNNAVALTISYSNLEETLKGCLEGSPEDLQFYRSLLIRYSGPSETFIPAASA